MIPWIKIISIGSTLLGGAASLLGGWASNKKMEELITKKVVEEIAKQTTKG